MSDRKPRPQRPYRGPTAKPYGPPRKMTRDELKAAAEDAYAEGIADTIDRLRVRAAEMLPEVARFTLDEIEVAAADLLASSTAEKTCTATQAFRFCKRPDAVVRLRVLRATTAGPRRRGGTMSDNPYTGLHGSDNRAAAKGWDEGFAAADERIARLLRESDVMEGEWLERTAQLVGALELIRAHARLDLSQRGIAEAERYAVIADDALAAADREAPDEETPDA